MTSGRGTDRGLRITAAVLLSVSVLLCHCGQSGRKGSRYGGTLRIGTYHRPEGINPLLTAATISANLADLIFNGLVKTDESGKIVPDLAERWESPDGKVWTFYLRKGVLFHDGVECTAEDVKFTYENIQFGWFYRKELIERFETDGPYTFRVVLRAPFARMISRMYQRIVPKHLLSDASNQEAEFSRHPVGTGPFRFVEWAPDDKITLVANEEYFERRPYLDRIEVITFPKANPRMLWGMLIRDEIDVAVGLLMPRDLHVIQNDPYFQTYTYTTVASHYYMLLYNLREPLFSDRNVRMAISHAIDTQSVIDEVLLGYGQVCTGPFHPTLSWAYNPEVEPVKYDPVKALDLLNETGWRDVDEDGFLEKGGKEFEFVLVMDEGDEVKERAARVVRQQLNDIGIRMKARFLGMNDLLDVLQSGAYQATFTQLNGAGDPDHASWAWHSSMIGGFNFAFYENSEVDRLFESGRLAVEDEERTKIYRSIHALIASDAPATFLFFPETAEGVAARFKGVKSYLHTGFYGSIKDWYISEGDTYL